jgi:hypothetical protein
MKRTIITYYEWLDIQSEICKEMGIGEEYFRDYHKIAGGHYKDLWHIWLHHFDVEVRNDTIVSNDLGDSLESKLEYLIKEEGEWVRPFVQAVYQVWDKYEIEYVRYFW